MFSANQFSLHICSLKKLPNSMRLEKFDSVTRARAPLKRGFEPVVATFKALLACFRCETCKSWLHVTPRRIPESLRCGCNATSFNLRTKPE